mmetsp:Transcript_10113/g.28390  ORF Transcript_10113/g.28390 Transcript_10113/m.28390 type:complete len:141 (-) Transcript_10113:39-461(-)
MALASLVLVLLACILRSEGRIQVIAFSPSPTQRWGTVAPARILLSGRRSTNNSNPDENEEAATNIHVTSADGSNYDLPPYQPPQHTSSFLEHLSQVKSAWPDTDDDDEGTDRGGVQATGEPSVDPSRTIQASQTDDSTWM